MLKNSKVVLFVTLRSWSGWILLNPTAYMTLKSPELLFLSKMRFVVYISPQVL
jgi:hypothetical protein